MNKVIMMLFALLLSSNAFAGLRYNDCVEITDDFYSSEETQLVGWVVDKRENNGITEYKVGNLVFGTWFPETSLLKIDKSICEEVEKRYEKE